MKIISKDEAISQGLTSYFTGNPCKKGHVSPRSTKESRCIQCRSEQAKARYKKNPEKFREKRRNYYIENQDKERERRAKHNRENRESIRERDRDRYRSDPEKFKKRSREWSRKNKEKVRAYNKFYRELNRDYYVEWRKKNKEKTRSYSRAWSARNPEKLKDVQKRSAAKNPLPKFIRNSLKRIISDWNGGRSVMENLHGYSLEKLKARLEFQFKDGMSWDNYGEWHIDHKKPVSRFIEQGVTDPAIINALPNLQPLWAFDNMSKGSNFN